METLLRIDPRRREPNCNQAPQDLRFKKDMVCWDLNLSKVVEEKH